MTAEIIDLKGKQRAPNPGNGAREAMIELIASSNFVDHTIGSEYLAELVLMELWARGFKIVPIESAAE